MGFIYQYRWWSCCHIWKKGHSLSQTKKLTWKTSVCSTMFKTCSANTEKSHGNRTGPSYVGNNEKTTWYKGNVLWNDDPYKYVYESEPVPDRLACIPFPRFQCPFAILTKKGPFRFVRPIFFLGCIIHTCEWMQTGILIYKGTYQKEDLDKNLEDDSDVEVVDDAEVFCY